LVNTPKQELLPWSSLEDFAKRQQEHVWLLRRLSNNVVTRFVPVDYMLELDELHKLKGSHYGSGLTPLHFAARHSHGLGFLYLLIDTICIDQAENWEQSYQAFNMAEGYRSTEVEISLQTRPNLWALQGLFKVIESMVDYIAANGLSGGKLNEILRDRLIPGPKPKPKPTRKMKP